MIEAVVIGVSAGGVQALTQIVPALPQGFDKAVIVVQHLLEGTGDFLARHLDRFSAIRVKEAEEKEAVLPATAYIAPAGYHLLIEDDRTFGLSDDPLVNFSRPSIDVLFESAAEVYADRLVGVILTGANYDGAQGLASIKRAGGLTVVQDPETAEAPMMPREAIKATQVDYVLGLLDIAPFLSGLHGVKHTGKPRFEQETPNNGFN